MRKKSKSNTISTESVSKCPCGQTIKGRPAWIACDTCGQWWHGSCVSLTKDICGIFKAKNLQYVCPVCIVSKVTGNKELQEKDNCVDNLKRPSENDIVEVNSPETQEDFKDSKFTDECSKKLVIVDGLKNPCNFQNSRVIKQEIRKHKGNIPIKYAYPLNSGGVAIHVESEEALETLKLDWPEEAFEGGSSISVHENADIVRCVLKNVAPFLTTDTVNLEVERQTGISVNSRRLRYRDTNRPMPIVLVTCKSKEDLQNIFKSKIVLNKRRVIIKDYQSKKFTPTRCYNCQAFGHIASLCKTEKRCEYCSESHTGSCTEACKCVNCGNHHRASSTSCPVYIAIKERLGSRK